MIICFIDIVLTSLIDPLPMDPPFTRYYTWGQCCGACHKRQKMVKEGAYQARGSRNESIATWLAAFLGTLISWPRLLRKRPVTGAVDSCTSAMKSQKQSLGRAAYSSASHSHGNQVIKRCRRQNKVHFQATFLKFLLRANRACCCLSGLPMVVAI